MRGAIIQNDIFSAPRIDHELCTECGAEKMSFWMMAPTGQERTAGHGWFWGQAYSLTAIIPSPRSLLGLGHVDAHQLVQEARAGGCSEEQDGADQGGYDADRLGGRDAEAGEGGDEQAPARGGADDAIDGAFILLEH